MYNNMQNAIKRLVKIDKVQPVIIIDDAHKLSRDILKSLKILFDFDMDSKDYTILILIGQDELKYELSKKIYKTIHQRIIVNYKMRGLSREEVKQYIKTRFEISNVNIEIFTEDALNALYSCSKSSLRRLNTLILNCLMLGCQNKIQEINSEIVMEAKGEMNLD
ncbi:MAG: AAA family ATPase [Bacilli bacterium]|nr:AAA family ATPase [Bacilli bacterium]